MQQDMTYACAVTWYRKASYWEDPKTFLANALRNVLAYPQAELNRDGIKLAQAWVTQYGVLPPEQVRTYPHAQ